MRKVGTANIVEIMDHFDLLPTHNFQFGSHPDSPKINSKVGKRFTQSLPDGCLGCTMSCSHGVDHFPLQTGPYAGQIVLVDGPEYETVAGWARTSATLIARNDGTQLLLRHLRRRHHLVWHCIAFAMECYEEGILNKENTGGLELNFGNGAPALELIHQMARGEGFGVIVGQGVRDDEGIVRREFRRRPAIRAGYRHGNQGYGNLGVPDQGILAQQGGYGLATKGPQHDEAWLIFMDQVHNLLPTFKDKAEALHYFPMWRTWFSLHGLCKLPWNDISPENNKQTKEPAKVEEHVENYTWIHQGVTGASRPTEDLTSSIGAGLQLPESLRPAHGTRHARSTTPSPTARPAR